VNINVSVVTETYGTSRDVTPRNARRCSTVPWVEVHVF